MKDEYQKILGEFAFNSLDKQEGLTWEGEFAFNSLDKQEGLTWEAFTAFFEKFYEEYTDIAPSTLLINGLKGEFSRKLTPEARKWFCEIFSEEEKSEPEKEVFYHIGQRFIIDDCEHLLALCEINESPYRDDAYVALIDINHNSPACGKYLRHSIKVNNYEHITAIEFKAMCNGHYFTLIEET